MREPSDAREIVRAKYDAKYVVSDVHGFVYFIIQKAACTSIKSALLPLFDIDTAKRVAMQEHGANYGVHKILATSGYLIDKGHLIAELNGKYRDYFKFAFVRNPWDRLVSCYSEKVVDSETGFKPSDRKGIRLGRGTSFAEFIETICTIPDDEANIHVQSQYKTVCRSEEDGTIMSDFVGRFENLAADFDVVAERIGGAQKPQLPHKHRSRSRGALPYTEFYNDRLRALVYERFRDDIEIFGYSFGETSVLPPLWPGSQLPKHDDTEGLRERNRDLEQAFEMLSKQNWDLEKSVEVLGKRNRDLKRQLRSARKQMRQLRFAESARLVNRIKRFGKRIVSPSSKP